MALLSTSVAQSALRCLPSVFSVAASAANAAWVGRRSVATDSCRVLELRSDSEYQQALSPTSAAVIKFTAKWCGPCKMMAPLYEKLSQELPGVRFYTVDIDNKEVSRAVVENKVVGVPNFSFFLAGERVAYFRGAKKEQLLSMARQLEEAQQQLGQSGEDALLQAGVLA